MLRNWRRRQTQQKRSLRTATGARPMPDMYTAISPCRPADKMLAISRWSSLLSGPRANHRDCDENVVGICNWILQCCEGAVYRESCLLEPDPGGSHLNIRISIAEKGEPEGTPVFGEEPAALGASHRYGGCFRQSHLDGLRKRRTRLAKCWQRRHATVLRAALRACISQPLAACGCALHI